MASGPSQGSPANAGQPFPLDVVQSNVTIATGFRLELLKQLVVLAGALFAFTLGFFTTYTVTTAPAPRWLAWIGWVLLALSVAAGLFQIDAWERFFISYRDWDHHENDPVRGKRVRDGLTTRRRVAKVVQYLTLALGAASVTVYATLRLQP